jgi:hypothetical protein
MLARSYFAKVAAGQPALHGESSTGESELVLLFQFHISNFNRPATCSACPKPARRGRAVGECFRSWYSREEFRSCIVWLDLRGSY